MIFIFGSTRPIIVKISSKIKGSKQIFVFCRAKLSVVDCRLSVLKSLAGKDEYVNHSKALLITIYSRVDMS